MAVASTRSSRLEGRATSLVQQSNSHSDQLGEEYNADRQLLEAFMNLYQPSSYTNRNGVTIGWLNEACFLADLCPTLRLSLHALAANRVAAIAGDEGLAATSRECYSNALIKLNELLGSSESVFDDQALAAIRCLMIYEVRTVAPSPPIQR